MFAEVSNWCLAAHSSGTSVITRSTKMHQSVKQKGGLWESQQELLLQKEVSTNIAELGAFCKVETIPTIF